MAEAEVLKDREDDVAWLLIGKWENVVFDSKPEKPCLGDLRQVLPAGSLS